MNARSFLLVCGFSGLLPCALGRAASLQAVAEATTVSVSRPVAREVTDCLDFTGRTEAVSTVKVVARVSGYLVKAPFREGAIVKAGDLLFEIDPRPYQAQYDLALAQLNLSQGQLKFAQAQFARDQQTVQATPGSISAQQIDQDRAAVAQAEAQLKVGQAGMAVHKLNLEFCKVTSPIEGQASRHFLTPGNLVSADQTVLTTVVSLDPIYVYFDIDESTMLRMRRAVGEQRIKPSSPGQTPVLMGLQNEDGFPHKGVADFVDNHVNPSSGTVVMRGKMENRLPPGGQRLLLPGLFVRIRLPMGRPHQALLVVECAIGSDQGVKYVYVVNAKGEIAYQRVELGPLESDGLRVIEKGLNAGDQVVVNRLQQIYPGTKVQTQEVPMTVREGSETERSKPPAVNRPAGDPPAGAAEGKN
jgi:multidrug efflux system membrane fusion protein